MEEPEVKRIHMPEWKNQITAGNVLQLGMLVVAMAAAWTSLDLKATSAAASLTDHEARIRALEVVILTKLTDVNSQISHINRQLDSIDRKLK